MFLRDLFSDSFLTAHCIYGYDYTFYGRLCAEQRNIFLIKMLSQEPNLCSAEKPRRSQSSLCVITTERIYTIGFNAPQNPNLAFAFLCIFFLSHASLPRASLQMELFLCSKNLNIDTPIFCDYNLVEKYVEIYNFGD